ncbi:MAG: RNA polymerase sigma factor [Archangiaceae bacterium]|nr:RNA polymerase sigma factor [Archangiaceae bacterium]
MQNAPRLDVPPTLDDAQVIERVLQGQAELFELLMRRYNGRLYRAIRGVLRDEAQVEEVMQEAYLRAYSHLAQFDARASFATWLARIGVHEALSRSRRAAMGPVASETAVLRASDPKTRPDEQAANRELVQLLERAVDALPDGYREVFMLRRIDGFSVAETAELLSVTEETVKMRTFRANEQLRARLDHLVEESTEEVFAFPATRCNRVVDAVMSSLHRSQK